MNPEHNNSEFDVVIVGGGLVGSTLALLLANCRQPNPLNIALVEAGNPPKPLDTDGFDPRVVALTRQSEQLLTDINVWADIKRQRACAYQDMHVWDGDGTGSIHFNSQDVGADNLGHIVENAVALASLYQQIKRKPNIHWQGNAAVEQLGGSEQARELLLADGTRLRAPLIVAADGARSKLRTLAAIPLKEWQYGQQAIVTTVRTELPHQFTAWQRFITTGPLAFLPLQRETTAHNQEHVSSIVWSVTDAQADELMQLNDEQFRHALGRAFEYRLGQILSCDERFCFPLTARHADQYHKPGLVLVGDAAHTIHPLAGQGVNLGLADARVLATEIQRALNRNVPLNDESLLRRYQRQRKGQNLLTLAVMEAFKRLFGAEPLPLRWLRNHGLKQVDQMSWLKTRIVRLMLATTDGH